MKDTGNLAILLIFTSLIIGYITAEINSDDVSYFEIVTKSRYFVDKTKLLQVFLHHQRPAQAKDYAWDNETRAVAFTCPSGFGKTTNLDMIRRFFQLPFDRDTGDKIDKKTTKYYELFTDESLNLEIGRDKNFVERHFGEYPTIYLDFSNIRGSTTDEIISSTRKRIGRVMKSYKWLCAETRKRNKNPTDARLKQHLKIFKKVFEKTATAEDLIHALEGVAELLAKHFNKSRIMVLIDAYDTPITHAIINNIDAKPIFNYVDLLIKKFVKYERVPCHVMIVGKLGSFFKPWFGDSGTDRNWIDTIKRNLFLRCGAEFGKYFGFTDTEVDRLLTANDVDYRDREKLDIYFNNYKFTTSDQTNAENISLRYPKGISRYLEMRDIQDDHLDCDSLGLKIIKCAYRQEFFKWFFKLITKQYVPGDATVTLTFVKIVNLLTDQNHRDSFDDLTPYTELFLDNGYLSFAQHGVRIPNKMAENQVKRYANRFFFDYYNVNVTSSGVTTSIETILNSTDTTDEMLINLATSLQQMINSANIKKLDKFQFLSIVCGTLINYWDFDHRILMEYVKTGEGEKQSIDKSMLQNRDQKIALIVKICYKSKLSEAIDEAKGLMPAGWPLHSKGFAVVKYLGINLNNNNVEVGKGKSRKSV